MLDALGFFALLEAAGLAAAPLAALVLGRLPGAGLGFAKVLGVLLVGWLAWMAGSIGIAGYGPGTIAGAFAVVALPADDPARLRLWAGSEAVFAVAFAAMALLIAYAPDVWNTEKPMDA